MASDQAGNFGLGRNLGQGGVQGQGGPALNLGLKPRDGGEGFIQIALNHLEVGQQLPIVQTQHHIARADAVAVTGKDFLDHAADRMLHGGLG